MIVPLVFVVCLQIGETGMGACVGFLLRGTAACTLCYGSESSSSKGQDCTVVGLRVYELSATLGSWPMDRWACIPFFLLFGMRCQALKPTGS